MKCSLAIGNKQSQINSRGGAKKLLKFPSSLSMRLMEWKKMEIQRNERPDFANRNGRDRTTVQEVGSFSAVSRVS
jgi:hypothetical protein